jgi:hypothetical protein
VYFNCCGGVVKVSCRIPRKSARLRGGPRYITYTNL